MFPEHESTSFPASVSLLIQGWQKYVRGANLVFGIYQVTTENLILGTVSKGKAVIGICPQRCYVSSGKYYTIQTKPDSFAAQWTDYGL